MKKGSTLVLRGVLSVIALIILALCIFVLPVGLQTDVTNWYRPIIIGMYVAAIPFYVALYQSWLLLNYIDTNNAFSNLSVKALKVIKHCGVVISALYLVGFPYIFHVADMDDAPGVAAITLIIIFASGVIATFAALLEKLLKNVIDIKSENELTV